MLLFFHVVSTDQMKTNKQIPHFRSAVSEGHVQKKQLHIPVSPLVWEDDVVNVTQKSNTQHKTAAPLENIKAHKQGRGRSTDDFWQDD